MRRLGKSGKGAQDPLCGGWVRVSETHTTLPQRYIINDKTPSLLLLLLLLFWYPILFIVKTLLLSLPWSLVLRRVCVNDAWMRLIFCRAREKVREGDGHLFYYPAAVRADWISHCAPRWKAWAEDIIFASHFWQAGICSGIYYTRQKAARWGRNGVQKWFIMKITASVLGKEVFFASFGLRAMEFLL